jgi:uncharacterized protein YggE
MSLQFFDKRNLAVSALALGLSFGALLSPALTKAAWAEDAAAARRTMTLSGIGEISARPDIAYLDSGVVTEGATAAEALAANTKAMTDIFAGLEAMKIAKDDIRTSQFSVNPVYDQPPVRPDGTQQAPKIRGYQVTNQVTVTVRQLDALGSILDKLVQVGSNRLDSIRFEIENPEPLLDKAREAAVADALRKAKLYARAAGVALGPILTISENGGNYPQPMYMKATMAMRDSAPVPVAAGTQQLSSNVSLTIGIE